MGRPSAKALLQGAGQYRTRLRLTVVELAARSNLSRATISKIESLQPVDVTTVLKLLDALAKDAQDVGNNLLLSELNTERSNIERKVVRIDISESMKMIIQAEKDDDISLNRTEENIARSSMEISNRMYDVISKLENLLQSGKLRLCANEDIKEFRVKLQQCDDLLRRLEKIRAQPTETKEINNIGNMVPRRMI